MRQETVGLFCGAEGRDLATLETKLQDLEVLGGRYISFSIAIEIGDHKSLN